MNWWGTRQLGHSQERTTALYTQVMEELEKAAPRAHDRKAGTAPAAARPRHLRVVAPSPGVITKG